MKMRRNTKKKAYCFKKPLFIALALLCTFSETGFPGAFTFNTDLKSIMIDSRASATITFEKFDFIEFKLITPQPV